MTKTELAFRARITELEHEVKAEKLRSQIALEEQKVKHEHSLAVHREVNAKQLAEIGDLKGKINGLQIVDKSRSECPTCKGMSDQMLNFMKLLSEALNRWSPGPAPVPNSVTGNLLIPNSTTTVPGNVGTYIYGIGSGK